MLEYGLIGSVETPDQGVAATFHGLFPNEIIPNEIELLCGKKLNERGN